MPRRWGKIVCLGVVFLGSIGGTGQGGIKQVDPSVCVVGQNGCTLPGSLVQLELQLGVSPSEILAGQFAIHYDPALLEFRGISAGSACDSSSPFVLPIFSSVDRLSGNIIFAVATLPFMGGHDPTKPATLACLSFLPRGVATTNVCVLSSAPQVSSLLVDNLGQAVSISDAVDCPTQEPDPALSCRTLVIEQACQCELGTADCALLDTPCREGVCDAQTNFCMSLPANEGNACDDGNACTSNDVCFGGRCIGSGCTNPSLCIESEDCNITSRVGRVLIRLGAGEPTIVGGQFSLRYDPNRLRLVDISPGGACVPGSPFTLETARIVDEVQGRIFYAAAISPGAGGTNASTVLACATFESLALPTTRVCLFNDINPSETRLVDQTGKLVAPFNEIDCPTSLPAPITSCATPITFCPIPAMSQWGLVVLALLLLIGAKTYWGYRRTVR